MSGDGLPATAVILLVDSSAAILQQWAAILRDYMTPLLSRIAQLQNLHTASSNLLAAKDMVHSPFTTPHAVFRTLTITATHGVDYLRHRGGAPDAPRYDAVLWDCH